MENRNGKVITINLFKGGVGKSTLVQMFGVILSEMGYKVLLVDTDPQGNLTNKLLRMYDTLDLRDKKTIWNVIEEHSFLDSIEEVTDELSIVAGDWQMANLIDYVIDLSSKSGNKDSMYYMYDYMINNDRLREKYDFIIFDTIPTTTVYTNNCLVASDYLIMPTQTEQDSIDNLVRMLDYASLIKRNYNTNLKIEGIVAYLIDVADKTTAVSLLEELYEEYPDLMFKNYIKDSRVVKRWGREGLTRHKPYDKVVKDMYLTVVEEFLERM